MEFLNEALGGIFAQFGSGIPKLIGALVLLIVGLIIAKIIRKIAQKGLSKAGIDKILKGSNMSLAATAATIIYFIVVLVVLTLVLEMMGLTAALDPIKEMLSKFLGYIPNIVAAGIIGFVGYMIANIAKEAVGMMTSGLNSLAEKYGMGTMNLSGILKQIVFIFIFIPILLVALDALNISTISDPAKSMLQGLFDAIPNIIAAAIILAVFIFGGKFIAQMIGEMLNNMNINKASESLGISSMIGEKYSLSDIISKTIYFFIVFFGIITAIEKLQFTSLTETLQDVMGLTGHVLFGLIILIIGNKISEFVSNYFAKSDAAGLSSIARFATLGLFLAIALRYTGIADDIVNLAFGLTLGSVAVAFALSFGLGGREAAGKQMDRFFDKFGK